jgi:hypothetical protein
MARKLTMARRILVACLICAGVAWAQNPYKVEYFSNANTAGAADASLKLDNPGGTGANLCADIFVFDANEELSECCSCLESPDGLRTLSLNADLTANPLTSSVLTTGVIKIVAAAPQAGTCPVPAFITTEPHGEIKAWATHIQDVDFDMTESVSQDSYLSPTEQTELAHQCGAILGIGSGKGVCGCGSGS